jgi:hypothetical protein
LQLKARAKAKAGWPRIHAKGRNLKTIGTAKPFALNFAARQRLGSNQK